MEIDVNKCDFYSEREYILNASGYTEGNDYCFCYMDNICENHPDCYYKQLQQLKAELQAYKDKVKPVTFVDSDEYFKVVVENKQLKAENDELRKEKDKYYQMTLDDEIQLNNLYQELQKESDLGHKAICEEMDSFFEVMKLQKVLYEIEEILKDTQVYSSNPIHDKILQKIKQAKENVE